MNLSGLNRSQDNHLVVLVRRPRRWNLRRETSIWFALPFFQNGVIGTGLPLQVPDDRVRKKPAPASEETCTNSFVPQPPEPPEADNDELRREHRTCSG